MREATKAEIIGKVEDAITKLSRKIERINDGDITFSEAGDWLHSWGDDIVSALEAAKNYLEKEAVN